MPGTQIFKAKLHKVLKDSEEDVESKRFFMRKSFARQLKIEEILEKMEESGKDYEERPT